MAFTLKSNALTAKVVNLIMVDDDDTTVVDIGNTPATLTVNGAVTIQDFSWNSVTRKAFQTTNNGSFDFFGITFSANPPPLKHGSGEGGNTILAIFARGTTNGESNHVSVGTSAAFGMGFAANVPVAKSQSVTYGGSETFTATDFSQRIIVAQTHEYGAVRQVFSDVDGGTDTAHELDTTDAGFGTTSQTIVGIGGWSGQGYQIVRMLMFINFSSKLSLAEIQSIRDDPFDALIDSGGGGAAARPNLLLMGVG